ncbi:MAG: hypothetical protein ABI539_05290 [Acidobacteriota bacterium]
MRDPIHENLSTSFVNIEALVKYLRRLQFVGKVRIELSSYEAEIVFTAGHRLRARDLDHITGRETRGMRALEQIFTRSQEPCGRIDVISGSTGDVQRDVFIDETIVINARNSVTGLGDRRVISGRASSTIKLSGDWPILLQLLSELIAAIDDETAKVPLDFESAFKGACRRLSLQYPFLDPASDVVKYVSGHLTVKGYVDPELLTVAMGEVLYCILARLRRVPRLSSVFHASRRSVISLALARKKEYDRFLITKQVERLIGG